MEKNALFSKMENGIYRLLFAAYFIVSSCSFVIYILINPAITPMVVNLINKFKKSFLIQSEIAFPISPPMMMLTKKSKKINPEPIIDMSIIMLKIFSKIELIFFFTILTPNKYITLTNIILISSS